MATINHWLLNDFIQALCRTLMHSLWQGLLAAMLAAILLLCTKTSKAVVRYNSLMLIFFGMVVVSTITLILELNSLTGEAPNQPSLSASISQGEFTNPLSSVVVEETNSVWQGVYSFIDRNAFLLISLWAFFFVLHLLRMLIGMRHIHLLQRKEACPSSSEWAKWIDNQSRELRIVRPVQLLESAIVKVPAAIGFFKPVILLPVGLLTGLLPSQVEGILRHELAHIKRGDYMVNLLQSVVDAIFFFNPSMVWISSLIRQERESCCDEIAVSSPASGPAYVEALLSFQTSYQPASVAMTLSSGRNYLLSRAKRILMHKNDSLSKREVISLCMGILLFTTALMAYQSKDDGQQIKNKAEATEFQPNSFLRPLASFDTSMYQDTVPPRTKKVTTQKKTFKKIITNRVDDGKQKTEQVIATDEKGNEYRVRKEGGQLKQLQVNGKTIEKQNERQYQANLDEIEKYQQQQRLQQRVTIEHNKKLLESKQLVRKQQELNKRLAELDRKHQQQKLELLKHQQELLKTHQKTLLDDQVRLEKQKNLFKEPHTFHPFKKIPPFSTGHQTKFLKASMNPTLAAILQDLKSQNMVADEKRFSFSLREGELVVDGKVQPQNLYEVFRKKYLKSSGDRFSYSRDGNPTRTEVNIQ